MKKCSAHRCTATATHSVHMDGRKGHFTGILCDAHYYAALQIINPTFVDSALLYPVYINFEGAKA